MSADQILSVDRLVMRLTMRFGGIVAVQDLSFAAERKKITALIGPNGAGKTTFINLLTGVLQPSSGDVILHGESIIGLKRERRVRKGLVRTFQINQLFAGLTVIESLALVISERSGRGWNWLRPTHAIAGIEQETRHVLRVVPDDQLGGITKSQFYTVGRDRVDHGRTLGDECTA